MTPPICGTFNSSRATASANTVIRRLIPPFRGSGSASPFMYNVENVDYQGGVGKPNWYGPSVPYTHTTDLWYTSLTTAHSLYVMRPLNWTYTVAAVGSNTTAVTIKADPGTWATAGIYKYGTGAGGSTVPNYANNVLAASDVLAFQLNDGSWQLDTCSSISGTALVLGTGTPNVTGAGIAAGSPIFWFGAVGDTDPATGIIHPLIDSVVNTAMRLQGHGGMPLWSNVHRGDPLVVHSSNGTDAGIIEHIGGFYSTEW